MTRKTLRRGSIVAVATVLCSLALVGCTDGEKEYSLKPTDALPTAKGTVTAWKDNLDDTVIDVEIKHVVPPIEMDDQNARYVVWAQEGGKVSKLGTVKLDGGSSGKLVTATHLKDFKVSVTIDEQPNPAEPKPYSILRTKTIHSQQLS